MTTTTHQQGEISPEHQAIIDAQVRDWRKEIARLQDLIAHATGGQQGESVDLDKLEAQANSATKGPWMRLFGERTVYDRMEDGCRGNAIVRADVAFGKADAANLDFIAAANPATILKLIAQARASQPSAASDAQPVGADEWVSFEAWAELTEHQKHGAEHDVTGWYYFDEVTQDRWEAWQARAALATPAASGHAGKPVAWIATDLDGRADVGLTKEVAKSRAGEGCTEFIPLFDLGDAASGQAGATVSGIVDHIYENVGFKDRDALIAEVQRMLAAPASPATHHTIDRNVIRDIFMHHGFTIKEGQTDLKSYVYEAAEALLAMASPATGTASIGDDKQFQALLDDFAYKASERRAMGGDFGSAEAEEVAEAALIAHIDARLSAAPATQQAAMDAARDAARYRFIEEHATMHGGGNGFTITCFVGTDEEDMGVGIDRIIAAMSASVSEADGSGKGALDVGDQS